MSRKITGLIASLWGVASLVGCGSLVDAKVVEPEVCITQDLQIPAGPNSSTTVTFNQASNLNFPAKPDKSSQLSEDVHYTRAQLIATAGSDLSFLDAFSVTACTPAVTILQYAKQGAGATASADVTSDTTVQLPTCFSDNGGKDMPFQYSVTGRFPTQASTVSLMSCLYAKAEFSGP